MPTLFIDLLIKPRKRFTIKTLEQDTLVQSLVLYAQKHYSYQSGWLLYKYGKSWGCLCLVDTLPFINWLGKFKNNQRINEILNIYQPYLEVDENTPQIAIYIPLNWYCITIAPVRDQIRDIWLSKTTHNILTETLPTATVSTLLPSDYYLLCEGRAISDVWQQHFEVCLKKEMPFIVLWHYRPKQKSYTDRYDILFSWEPFIKSHSHIFDNPKYPDIGKVIARLIAQILKDYHQQKGFEKTMLQGVLVNGQINILKLSFEAAQKLILDLVKMLQQLIMEMEERVDIAKSLEKNFSG
ncbi:hypothetical protein [Photorhabdus africana]|uniref:hypothetical protein n=1 Tax=Photorhabdus africana TaxID=3097554 RepID=UPI002B40D72F|nr:hypothetical protein [Photorhabdus sp. CRI-LC]